MGVGCCQRAASGPATPTATEEHVDFPRNDQCIFCLGQRVVVTSLSGVPELGTVRYVGTEEGGILGLEMDYPGGIGCHNGHDVELGRKHFSCRNGTGVYIAQNSFRVQPVPALAADSVSVLHSLALSLETLDEQETLRRLNMGRQAHARLRASPQEEGNSWLTSYRKIWDSAAEKYVLHPRGAPLQGKGLANAPRGATVLPAEGGPEWEQQLGKLPAHLPAAAGELITPAEALAVFEHCRRRYQEPLPADLILKLVRVGRTMFLQEPTVRKLSVPPNGKLVVFGDTHGHLKDLVHVWATEGLPSSEICYLFNGDICDRGDSADRGGQQAVHIWACVLSYKLAFPERVHMNRGNHEDHQYSLHYGARGFYGEIHANYAAKEAESLTNAFKDLCECLPLATVIDGQVLVVHAGLPRRGVTLEEVGRISRPLVLNLTSSDRLDKMAADMTWTDPQHEKGTSPSARGPGVVSFGPDVSADFLSAHRLRLIIRSHQVPEHPFAGRGIQWWHPHRDCGRSPAPEKLASSQEGLCLTVFSASDYCGSYGANAGGIVVFSASPAGFTIKEHTGEEAETTLKMGKARESSKSEQPAAAKASISMELVVLILKHRHSLLQEFRALDVKSAWFLTIDQFVAACKRAVPGVAWQDILPHFSEIFPQQDGRISYTRFLSKYRLCFSSKSGEHTRVYNQFADKLFGSFLRADRTLRETLGILDPDSDGIVTAEEFAAALARTGCMLHDTQVPRMFRAKTSHDSTVHVEDFLGSLSVGFALKHMKAPPAGSEFVPAKLDSICRDICNEMSIGAGGAKESVPVLLRKWFQHVDKNNTGFLRVTDLAEAMQSLPSSAGLSTLQLLLVAKYVDGDSNGSINYLEVLEALSVQHSKSQGELERRPDGGLMGRPTPDVVLDDMVETVCCVLALEYGFGTVRGLLQHMLPPGSTRCTPAIFQRALMALTHGPSEVHLSDQQVQCLVDSIDIGDGDDFDFDKYFKSFDIIDTERSCS